MIACNTLIHLQAENIFEAINFFEKKKKQEWYY